MSIPKKPSSAMTEPRPSLSVAYHTQRASMKKMAAGGMIKESAEDVKEHYDGIADAIMAKRKAAKMMAEGGETSDDTESQHYMDKDEQNEALRSGKPLSDLYNPKPSKKMAAGGAVDNEESPASLSPYDDENALDGDMKELYDDTQISSQPTGSNEHGDEIESDAYDMIGSIRKKLRDRRGF